MRVIVRESALPVRCDCTYGRAPRFQACAPADKIVTIVDHANDTNRQEFSYALLMIRFVVFFCLALFPLRFAVASDGALHPLDALSKAPILAADGYEVTPLAEDALARQPVVVTFFASWCPPCTIEFQEIKKLQGMFPGGGYSVVGISLFENFGGLKNPERMTRSPTRFIHGPSGQARG